MNINEARTLANINNRAQRITEDYRLIWNRHDQAFFVAHKEDRSRRYKVTADTCTCLAVAKYGECKHFLGLPALLEVEIQRYTLLGFAEERARMEAFRDEIEDAAKWAGICAEVENAECLAGVDYLL